MRSAGYFRKKIAWLKLKKWICDRRGMTLVELIVTFALLGLFMTAASSMLTSTLQLFTRMQATSRAITVSDMLLDKISGEIAAAILPPNESTDGYYFWLQPKTAADSDGKSRWIVFRNRSKSPIAIFAAEAEAGSGKTNVKADVSTIGKENLNGELFIRYYEVSENSQRKVPDLDWHLDSRAYMGYVIKDLWFEREHSDSHPNVVKIHLTLYNPRTEFEYTTFRYAENYNYDFASNYMCERTDIEEEKGNTSFPEKAEEFKIKQPSGGESSGGGSGDIDPEPSDDSLTLTDHEGNKYVLHTNLDWEEVKKTITEGGLPNYQFEDKKAWLMGDETGFYIIINAPSLSAAEVTSQNTTLAEANIANKYKITEDMKVLTQADLRASDRWKSDRIPRDVQNFAFMDGKYYFAGTGVGEWVVPPQSSWVFIPQ